MDSPPEVKAQGQSSPALEDERLTTPKGVDQLDRQSGFYLIHTPWEATPPDDYRPVMEHHLKRVHLVR